MSQAVRKSFLGFLARGTEEARRRLLSEKSKNSAVVHRREKRVADAIKDIEKCNVLPDAMHENIWTTVNPVFEGRDQDAYGRITCLVRGVGKLEALHCCMIRMGLLFLSHEVERVEAEIMKTQPTFARGRGLRSEAYKKIRDACDLQEERLKYLCRRSKVYMTIAAQSGGLGILLALGSITST